MESYYVYFEHVIIINLLLNFLILWITAKLCQFRVEKRKLILGALIGAAYSFMLLIPYLGVWFNLTTKLLMSFSIIYVAFRPLSLRKFFQGLISFYLTTFLIGGTILGLGFFIQDSPVANYLGAITLVTENLFYFFLVVILGYFLLGRKIQSFMKKNVSQGLLKTLITIRLEKASQQIEALLDTGNHLRDPISKFPVIIVEYEAIKHLLPENLEGYCSFNVDDLDQLLNSLATTSLATRVRVIPFKSLGKDNGLLLGFVPEELIVHKAGQNLAISQVIVGIYNQKLSPEGNYRALLHPDILYS